MHAMVSLNILLPLLIIGHGTGVPPYLQKTDLAERGFILEDLFQSNTCIAQEWMVQRFLWRYPLAGVFLHHQRDL